MPLSTHGAEFLLVPLNTPTNFAAAVNTTTRPKQHSSCALHRPGPNASTAAWRHHLSELRRGPTALHLPPGPPCQPGPDRLHHVPAQIRVDPVASTFHRSHHTQPQIRAISTATPQPARRAARPWPLRDADSCADALHATASTRCSSARRRRPARCRRPTRRRLLRSLEQPPPPQIQAPQQARQLAPVRDRSPS
jgi:hypothetical protein